MDLVLAGLLQERQKVTPGIAWAPCPQILTQHGAASTCLKSFYNTDAATELRFHDVLLEHLPSNGFLNRAEPLLLQLPYPFSEDSTCFPAMPAVTMSWT
eukprot:s3425_g1.t1